MVDTETFYNAMRDAGIGFFAGVPDSLLSPLCACVATHAPDGEHCITANEGAAVALAAGNYLAQGNPALVYMQNSGLGNAINPLLSLADDSVYGIPMLLLIGWRGEPGVKDEPQHLAQGGATVPLLEAMGITHHRLPADTGAAISLLEHARKQTMEQRKPVVILAGEKAFTPYSSQCDSGEHDLPLAREEAIRVLLESIEPRTTVVSATGMISRELYELREQMEEGHDHDFLSVGSMGHCCQIALGIALAKPDRRVFCLDGDGSALMHMGSMAITAQSGAANLAHIVLNNGSHASVGGQPTCGFQISFADIARGCGYQSVRTVVDGQGIRDFMSEIKADAGPTFLEIRVHRGSRADLGRPGMSLSEQKENFMRHLEG
ncbi:MAG: phosphonopyruvate decarboxylase [Akkermansiaceae bacterium]